MPEFIDHIDRDPMNNRINNLRACSPNENRQNVGPQKRNTSGYKGVSWNKRDNLWQAMISINGTTKNLGSFNCKHEAAKAYNKAAKTHYKEFAYINAITS
jgi:hypothetical protein